MSRLWSFLGEERNRQILGWAGGGLAVVAAGLWAVVTYLHPPGANSTSKPAAGIEANCGGIAVGGNVSGATITAAGGAANCSPKTK
jgi:hypothetical protein